MKMKRWRNEKVKISSVETLVAKELVLVILGL